jgi:arylsulfatase A
MLRIPLAIFLSAYLVSTAPAASPNIVFIMADDVGSEVLGCYGGSSYQTPHLDELASGGTRFRHCYSMPKCHPSRVCLLTGRYPSRVGADDWGDFPQSEEQNTFAHMLKRTGYATAVAGKWQLTLLGSNLQHPYKLGFDEYSLFGWHEGPRYHQPLIWQNGTVRDDVKDRYGPDVYCDYLIDFITRNQDEPFFAYYAMTLCHSVSNDFDKPVPLGPNGRYQSYKELVEQMDGMVGRVVAALDRLRLREKTLIIFTTDNGTMKRHIVDATDGELVHQKVVSRVGEKLVPGEKGELTDGGTRVPLIVSWQGVTPAGKVVDDLIDFSDFLPTFADISGADLPAGVPLDGQSFSPQIRGHAGPSRGWVHSEHKGKHWVRTQRWKLYDDGRFFDMEEDPAEKHSLEPTEQTPQVRAVHNQLAAALGTLLGEKK